MKKRILAGLMISVMVLASAMCVSAAPSVTDPVQPGQPGDYEVTTESPNFKNLTGDTKATIEKMNKGEEVTLPDKVNTALSGKKIVQKFFEIKPLDNHDKCEDQGYHTVTLKVTGVTNWNDIVVVHYNTNKGTWETFSESANTLKVDRNKGTLTFDVVYADLDSTPFAIYAKGVDSGDAGITGDTVVGTSPTTQGVSSAWMLFAAMALVVLGSSVVVYQKKRG